MFFVVKSKQERIELVTRPGTRRNKCGILPFIANFERFVATTEAIFKSSERRVDLEKWYLILVTAMVTAIARIAFQVLLLRSGH